MKPWGRPARPLWRFVLATWLAAVAIHPDGATAQSYPSKPIRIVVPFAPGGALDSMARLVGQNMAETLKQPVVIENRPGADGSIGADRVARAAPDGYTVLVTGSELAIRPAIFRRLPFDAATDFARVTQLLSIPLLLVVGPNVPAASMGELIALAKSRPGGMNYGHTGVGTQMHLAMEMLKRATDIDMLPIPYKGSAPIQTALTAREVEVAFTGLSSGAPWVKSGRGRALAVSGPRRSAVLPEVPTIAEAGVAGFEVDGQQGMYAPAHTPRPVIGVLQQAAVRALHVPEIRSRLEALGNQIVGSTPEEFDAKFRADLAKYARVVKEARIPPRD